MTPDTALSLSVELERFLEGDWTMVEEPERFRIKSNDSSLTGTKLKSHLRDTAWHIAKVMGYRHFVSLSQEPDGSIKVTSKTESGEGFEILFEA